MVETDNRDVPPRLCCGDCLMLNVETIELKVVRVMVLA
jgi:hypothetical protein